MWGGHSCPPTAGNRIRIQIGQYGGIEPVRVGDPSQAPGRDAGDAVGDAVPFAKFLRAVFEQAD